MKQPHLKPLWLPEFEKSICEIKDADPTKLLKMGKISTIYLKTTGCSPFFNYFLDFKSMTNNVTRGFLANKTEKLSPFDKIVFLAFLSNVKKTEDNLLTFVYWAIESNDTEVLTLLLRKGVTLVPKDKKSVLNLSIRQDKSGIAEVLMKNGFPLPENDDKERTPLHMVTSSKMARVLINAGMDLETQDVFGQTPLYTALKYNQFEVVKTLIIEGANINKKIAYNGCTPLHLVKTKEAAKLLLDNGANPHIKNKKGHTPLDLARKNNNTEVADLLSQQKLLYRRSTWI